MKQNTKGAMLWQLDLQKLAPMLTDMMFSQLPS